MDNFDAEIIEWILKGGAGSGPQPGHPFRGNQYTESFTPNRGLLETKDAHDATKISHADWVKGGMKENSPFTTRVLGQKAIPVGAHLERPASIHAVRADELARQGRHFEAAEAYREAQANTYGKTTYIGQGKDGKDVVFPASAEWKMAQEAATYHDTQGKLNKSVVEKGDLLGHIFHGNQHSKGEGGGKPLRQVDTGRFQIDSDRYTVVGPRAHDHAEHPTPEGHADLASLHREAASGLEQMRANSSPKRLNALDEAIKAHNEAAEWHNIAAGNYGDKLLADKPDYLKNGSDFAAQMSDRADIRTKDALAFRKELNMNSEITKGDLPGHEFHGNQYSHMTAKSGILALAARAENHPDHTAIALGHRDMAEWHKAQAKAIYEQKMIPLGKVLNSENGDSFSRAYKAYGEASRAFDAHQLAAQNHAEAAQLHEQAARGEMPNGTRSYLNTDPREDAMFSTYSETNPSKASDLASDSTYFANQSEGNIAKSVSVVEKGDVQGHEFHGNQWTSGESGKIFDNYRPADINQTISQIGKMNILGISGGRVNPLRNTAGEPVGIHLPVSKGYGVNVLLHPNDTYTVQRVTTRSGVVKVKGQEDGVYAEDLGDTAYRAGMYVNVPFGDHKGTLG